MPERPDQPDGPIVLFDGVCNLCNASVAFILTHERGPTLRFASLQSETGRAMLVAHARDPDSIDTVVLIEAGRAWDRSDALLRIARHLRAPWRWGRALLVVPRFARDAAYRVIAKRRYRWFGKRDACALPSPAQTDRFVTDAS